MRDTTKSTFIRGPLEAQETVPDVKPARRLYRSGDLTGYSLVSKEWVSSMVQALEAEKALSDRLASALSAAQRHAQEIFFAAADVLAEHAGRRAK